MSADIPFDKPGFDLYADQRGRIIGSLTAILVITTIFTALRLLSRKLARAGFWWDDHLAVIAYVSDLLPLILWFVSLKYGFGRHIYIFGDEAPTRSRDWLRILWIFELAFHTTTTLAKYSILAFYYRIFPVPAFRRLLIWVAGLCTLYMIAIDLTIIFQCKPIHFAWNQALGTMKGHCIDINAFFIGSGACNSVLNLIVFILWLACMWYALRGTIASIANAYKSVLLVSIIWIVVLAQLDAGDVTWNFVNSGIWSALEPSMAVVCASIPSLRPLYSVAVGAYRNVVTSTSRTKRSSINGRTLRIPWPNSHSQPSEGMFSQLEEQGDDTKPLGHDVSIRGGRNGAHGEAIELPPLSGIHVKSEVLISTEKLEYKDWLF
ncbi:MAG: hypothetical protein Q9184_004724 [Pyrenodesmia sp. 2 TL-2023]